ncbi:MAG: T9SS type A sorting domain-containing protein, partial [Bacteroidota bacterium]|nr:T9SS type A sorting domain-containing protein [Bacteroidota bacterium]
ASLEAFPSPARHTLNVVAKAGSWVRVLNLQGQTVERRQLSSDREAWDVSTWPAGLHFLQVEGSRTTRRVLITH